MRAGSLAIHIFLTLGLALANRDGESDKVASASKLARGSVAGLNGASAASVAAAADGHFVKMDRTKASTKSQDRSEGGVTCSALDEKIKGFFDCGADARAVQTIISLFRKGEEWPPSGEDLKTKLTNNINLFLKNFDFDGNNKLDENEQDLAIKTARYFAGDDAELQEAEIADMMRVLRWFGGDEDSANGVKLDDGEARSMLMFIRKFDADGDDDLDDQERYYFVEVCQYFAGMGPGEHAITEAAIDSSEAQNMIVTIGHFDGSDNKLDKKEMRRMLRALEMYDVDNNKALDTVEQADIVVFIRFTGDDAEMTIEEHKNMEWVVDFFDGEDNKMQEPEAKRILDVMARFDFDRDGDLDETEQGILVRVGRYFATGGEASCTDCRDLGEAQYNRLIKVIGMFDGENNELDEDEANRLVLTLLYFDGEPDGKLSDVEQEHLVKIVTYFSDSRPELSVSAWEDMKKAIDYFCGADARLQTGPSNTGNKDEQEMLEQTCEAFANIDTGKEEHHYMSDQERGALMKKISEVASVKAKLTHTGGELHSVASSEETSGPTLESATETAATEFLAAVRVAGGSFTGVEKKEKCCAFTPEQRAEITEKAAEKKAKRILKLCNSEHWAKPIGDDNACPTLAN